MRRREETLAEVIFVVVFGSLRLHKNGERHCFNDDKVCAYPICQCSMNKSSNDPLIVGDDEAEEGMVITTRERNRNGHFGN